jgi:aminobenzoyl-glutamate utilization protein B
MVEDRLVALDSHRAEAMHPAEVVDAIHAATTIARATALLSSLAMHRPRSIVPICLSFSLGALAAAVASVASDTAGKDAALESIDRSADAYWQAALDIWGWAEPGYHETRSSKRLVGLLRDARFSVEEGVAAIPTAFVASYGSGQPVLGILAEFDALPGLSQAAVARREPRPETTWGHACGHHLFGVASTAAGIAVAQAIERGELTGTVRVYGTPAEEGGGAKLFMVRAGLFADVDAVLHWHPADQNTAGDPTNQARVAAKFRFRGKSAHAAAAPQDGRSALDGLNVMSYAAELLREHTPDLTRIHHVITAGGEAPNVVPDFAEAYYYVRHPDAAVARSVYDRLMLCARAGALATETELEVEFLGGVYGVLPNSALSEVSLRNLRALSDLAYSAEEQAFAREIQATLSDPPPLDDIAEVVDRSGAVESGSTDVGDVSWVVPTTGVKVATWVPGTPAHSWQATAAGGTTIGRQGMLLAAKTLAATAWDLFGEPQTLTAARRELEERVKAGGGYVPMLEEGQQPPLDYRDPPKAR